MMLKCDFEEKCNIGHSDMVNIHLIAHTHDDAGWLKNVEEYYTGSQKNIDRASVQIIINSVINSLELNPERKFSYVEAVYVHMWLKDPTRSDQEIERLVKLVKNGQLEIVSGGWVMHDEACTHYNDIINQMTLGFGLFSDAFGKCSTPTTGWQIDPFGHSAAQAGLLAQMGFHGLFFGRVSDSIIHTRGLSGTMEFLWSPEPDFSKIYDSDSPGGSGIEDRNEGNASGIDSESGGMGRGTNEILVSILPNLYQPPSGYCFDLFCGDDPIEDNPDSKEYNVWKKVDNFMNLMELQRIKYSTNHMIVTMGNDFHYQDAERWYSNLDKLIHYTNSKRNLNGSDTRFNLFYSTPGCYLYALRNFARPFAPPRPGFDISGSEEVCPTGEVCRAPPPTTGSSTNATIKWTVTNGTDFFPLISYSNTWTGYFSSRPTLKHMIRESSRLLQICKQIQVLGNLVSSDTSDSCSALEMAVGLAQHHDAITGTAKQAVTYDYAQRLSQGYPGCWATIQAGLKNLDVILETERWHFCPLLNISVCQIPQTYSEYHIVLYNPLPWDIKYYVTLPITDNNITLYSTKSEEPLPFQVSQVPRSVRRIPERCLSYRDAIGDVSISCSENFTLPTDLSLTFLATIPALGFSRYHTGQGIGGEEVTEPRTEGDKSHTLKADDFYIENEFLRLEFDQRTNLMKSITNKASRITTNLSQTFMYYGGNLGNIFTSGAYVLRVPMPARPNDLSNLTTNALGVTMKILKGSLYQQASQTFGPWVNQEVTLYAGDRFAEVTWTVGPIPVDDRVPKDVVTRYTSDLMSVGKFYTDSNSRFMIQRQNVYMGDGPMDTVAPNYYPVTSKAFLKDERSSASVPFDGTQRQLAIVTDRAQGCASLANGSLEFMVHRRLLQDDSLGVGEALNEVGSDKQGLVARGRHWLIFDKPKECNEIMTVLAQKSYLRPEIMFAFPLKSRKVKKLKGKTSIPQKLIHFEESLLNQPFPQSLQLLSLYKRNDSVILRIEHIFSPGEHETLSQPQKIDLKKIFKTMDVIDFEELTLGANQVLKDTFHYEWLASRWKSMSFVPNTSYAETSSVITMYPLDIRTFLLNVGSKVRTT